MALSNNRRRRIAKQQHRVFIPKSVKSKTGQQQRKMKIMMNLS